MKLKNGDLKGAWSSLVSLASRPAEGLLNATQYAEEGAAKVVDIAMGNDPNDPSSLSGQRAKDPRLGTTLRNKIVKWLGFGDKTMEEDASRKRGERSEVSKQVYNKTPIRLSGKFRGFGVDIDNYIREAAAKYGIDEKVLRGFIKMEAGWTGKMSPTGAIGTGQFTKGTWNELARMTDGKEIGMTPITGENFRKENDPRYNKQINTFATALWRKRIYQCCNVRGFQ